MFIFSLPLEQTKLFSQLNVKTCGAGIVLYDININKILLGEERKRCKHFWSDFGGKLCEGETVWQCAKRECCEETINLINIDRMNTKNVFRVYRMVNYVKYSKNNKIFIRIYIVFLLIGSFYDPKLSIEFIRRQRFSTRYEELEKSALTWWRIGALSDYIRRPITYRVGFRCRDILYFINNVICQLTQYKYF